MRYYEPVWNQLKKKKTARVTAHPALHARIVKAVVKEKWMDIGYKLEIDPYYAILTHSRSNSILTFTLHLRRDYSNITEHML
jgi:hypothetical protein